MRFKKTQKQLCEVGYLQNLSIMNETNISARNETAIQCSNFKGNGNPRTIAIINGVLNAPLILSAISGNALVLATIIRTPSLRSPSTTLLCSLALSDFFVGLVVQPLYVAKQFENFPGFRICEIMQFTLCGISLCTVTAISLDRFAALHYHMRYPAIVTMPRASCTSILIWLNVCLLSGFYFWNKDIFFLGISIAICICLFISSYSYYRIFRIVRQHQSQIHVQQQAMQVLDSNNVNMLRLKRSAINTFVFYISIILCYLPLLISLSLNSISKKHWSKEWELADTIVFMNSSINPVLYCWLLKELRIAVAKTIRKLSCRTPQGN